MNKINNTIGIKTEINVMIPIVTPWVIHDKATVESQNTKSTGIISQIIQSNWGRLYIKIYNNTIANKLMFVVVTILPILWIFLITFSSVTDCIGGDW